MATGTTNALPTWGETTGYVDTSFSNYKFDGFYIRSPLYIDSIHISYSYSNDWTGGLYFYNYGTRIGGCFMFTCTYTNVLGANKDFITVDFTIPLSPYWKNKSIAGTGTLFSLTEGHPVATGFGCSVKVDAYGTGATIGFQYRGTQYTLNNGEKYSITW